MKIFIISLLGQYERRRQILEQCHQLKLDVEIFDAVDGASLHQTSLVQQAVNFPECMLTVGEVGCALSHRAVYQRMIDEDLPFALILEDDVRIDSRLEKVLNQIELNTESTDENIYLLTPPESYYKNKKTVLGGTVEFYQVSEASCAMGYVVSQGAARTLISANTPVRWESDHWTLFKMIYGINLFCQIPHIVNNGDKNSVTSTIEQDRDGNRSKRGAYRHAEQRKIRFYQFKRLKKVLMNKVNTKTNYSPF